MSPKKPSTTEKVASVDEQEAPNASLSSVREKIAVDQTKETVRVDSVKGKKHVSSSRVSPFLAVD